MLFTSALAQVPKGNEQQKAEMCLQIGIQRIQRFLRSWQIVTLSFKMLWKLDPGLIMQEAKF